LEDTKCVIESRKLKEDKKWNGKKRKKGQKIIHKALDRTQKIEQHELGEGGVRYSGRINSSVSTSGTHHK